MGFFICLFIFLKIIPKSKKSKTKTLKKRNAFKLLFIHLFSIFNGFLKYKNHDMPAAKARHKGKNQIEYSVLKLNNVFLS
jgi:hypothetical protein